MEQTLLFTTAHKEWINQALDGLKWGAGKGGGGGGEEQGIQNSLLPLKLLKS